MRFEYVNKISGKGGGVFNGCSCLEVADAQALKRVGVQGKSIAHCGPVRNYFHIFLDFPHGLNQNTLKMKFFNIEREKMKKISTTLVTSGKHDAKVNNIRVETINPPVYHASTVLFDSYRDLAAAGRGVYPGLEYGTQGTPTQHAFERAMAEIEGGFRTRAFPSGINAIINAFMAYTRGGDHILVCDNVYGPTRRFCDRVLSKYNVRTDYFPSAAGRGEIESFIKPETTLIFLESPGSNTFEIQDIPAITRAARENDIVTVMDNTWATPLHLKPFELGVDVSIQSVTKYISGHSDVLMGTVTTSEKSFKAFDRFCHVMEPCASQDDCYLALRGLRSLAVRLKQHEKSALELAEWLEEQEDVETVLHPALPGHPEHAIWKRDFTGSSGLFAFTMTRERTGEEIASFVDALDLFGLGYSWGGFKSLMTVGKYRRNNHSRYRGRTIFRVNAGLEDVEDLKADLSRGFEMLESLG